MTATVYPAHPIQCVSSFPALAATEFYGSVNALCWPRRLSGNFSEIVAQIPQEEEVITVTKETLRGLVLTSDGDRARAVLLRDLKLLEEHGSDPTLNLIAGYVRDVDYLVFPTDVYSFHVDRSPIPSETFLCTYHGQTSELLANDQAIQQVLIPEVREEIKQYYSGPEAGFEAFLSNYYFDLHYRMKPGATPIQLGLGHLCKLAIDHPTSEVPPCVHRAPEERGHRRLMLIC